MSEIGLLGEWLNWNSESSMDGITLQNPMSSSLCGWSTALMAIRWPSPRDSGIFGWWYLEEIGN
jgi:hypothetical protein